MREAIADGSPIPVADLAFDNGLSLLSEPTQEWTLSADELSRRGQFGTASPYADGADVPPLMVGDVVMTTVYDPETDYLELVAIDATDGEVLWRNSDTVGACSALAGGELVACWRYWGAKRAKVFDVRSGDVVGELGGQPIYDIVADGDDALLIGLTNNYSLAVTRVDVSSEEEQWQRYLCQSRR